METLFLKKGAFVAAVNTVLSKPHKDYERFSIATIWKTDGRTAVHARNTANF